jgi:hypothetical protein
MRDRTGGTSDAAIRRPLLPLPEPEAPDAEAEIPRWRRQSLMAARKGAGHPAATHEHLRFDEEAEAAVEGFERRLVRYRLVSLLDVPDEVRGVAVGTLDEDDEVVVLERRGGYCCVLSPDGHEGWIHRMTLGGTPSPTHPDETLGTSEAVPPDHTEPVAEAPAESMPAGLDPERPEPPDRPSLHADLDPGTFEDILRVARELRGPSSAAP